MSKPLISIVVPVYNVAKYLRQCLDSILAQTFSNFEVILVDDGSTDKSGQICDEYAVRDARFRVCHRRNGGLASARGQGFQNASGKYIATIDSDDWVDSTYLDNMLSCMEMHAADCVICAYWRNVGNESTYIINKPSAFDRDTLVEDVLNHKYHAGLWNKMFRRSILMNGKIKSPSYSYYEDMFTYVSYLQYSSIAVYSDFATYHYRYCTESLTNKAKITVRMDMTAQVLNNLRDLFNQYEILRKGKMYEALCSCANFEKLRMLNEYPDDYNKYKKIICHILPNTYKLREVTGLSTLCRFVALKGWGYPSNLVKHLHERSYK